MKNPKYPFKIKQKNSRNYKQMDYAVHGFWSGKEVLVYQSRNLTTKKWEEPKIEWSCGGRDLNEEPDNIIATECFSKAVADAVIVARQWKNEKGRP